MAKIALPKMYVMYRIYLSIAVLCGFMQMAYAQTSPAAQSLPYIQTFSSTAHTGTAYPAGWQGWTLSAPPGASFNTDTPAADRSLIASSSASTNSGNIHNYNGKIGFLNNGSLDLSLVLAINTSGRKNIKVDYDVMTIRNPYDSTSNTRINEVTLQYRIGTTGSFTSLTGIEYQNNTLRQTGSGVTTPQKNERKYIRLPADCDSEAVVQLRWVSRQLSGGGARPSFAIDSIHIDTATAGEEISIAALTDGLEGASPVAGRFRIICTPATSVATTFDYAISGTATLGTDYTLTLSGSATPATITTATGTISLPAGTDSVIATVTPIDDVLSEGAEKVIFRISGPSGTYKITDSSATVRILDDEATLIHHIQGSGMSAVPGSYTVEGIVTGVYPTLSPAGFYMQEEDADADADPNTSEGIFVVSSTAVSPGDKVRVSGTVLESSAAPSYEQAVINTATVSIVSSGLSLPAAVDIVLPVTAIADLEKYEGMLVQFKDTLTVTDNYNLGRYGEINLSKGGMSYQPTQIEDLNDAIPSGTTSSGSTNLAAVNALATANMLRTILMDDGRGTIPTLPFVNTDNTLRLGSTISNLKGILGYAFSKYRIQPIPDAAPVFTYASRPAVPSYGTGANVKIASFNVLNYFNGNGTGGGFPTSRGAHSAAEFTRQRDKIIAALAAINADVVGLIELENDGTGANSAIQDLVSGLNAKMGAGTYSFVLDGAARQDFCTDEIRCGIIFKPAVVDTAGNAVIGSDPVFNRPPLAQAFTVKASEISFNYVINHFKSKSCSGATGPDADQLDGQSCYNSTRKKQAGALIRFITDSLLPASGSPYVLSMGDYNAYFEEDPLDSIRAAGYSVLSEAKDFSYLFMGLVGSLDNAFVNDTLKEKVTAIAKWNINSAEPTHLDYNDDINDGSGDFVNPWSATYTPTPFRSSDHDPVLIGLKLERPAGIPGVTELNYSLYPNPVAALLHLQASESLHWEIIGLTGQLLQSGTTIQAHTTIDIAAFAPGLYLFRVQGRDGSSHVRKWIKE